MKIAVVHNPAKVDDAELLRTEIKQRWPDDEVIWLETTVEDPGEGQAHHAIEDGAELVLVCGGDGTVAACAGPLADTGVAMALVPFGTGNLLARNLGLPLEIGEALDLAARGVRDGIDVVSSGDRCFTVMAGLGFDAAMMRDTNETTKDRLGWIAYAAGGARALRRTRRRRYTLTVDGARQRPVSALAVLVANVGELQGGMAVLPDADPRDGRVDVIVVAPRSWRDIPALLVRLLRHRLSDSPRTSTYRARTVTVRVDEPVPVQFDGDYDTEVSELSVTVRPGALVLCGR